MYIIWAFNCFEYCAADATECTYERKAFDQTVDNGGMSCRSMPILHQALHIYTYRYYR